MTPQTNIDHSGFFMRIDRDSLTELRSTVLIIDDHENRRAYLREYLSDIYHVEEASNSQEGVRMAKQMTPDLIITAPTTQTVESESLCFHLKHFEQTNHIPIIIISENNDPNDRIRSFYLGADDFMTLPLQKEELQVRIENLIRLRKTLHQKFSKQIDLKPTSIEIKSKDEVFLQRAMTVLESNMSNPLFGSEQFAREMGLSLRHLCRRLQALTEHSSSDLIRNVRLKRAGDLLQKQAGNVSEIAYQVGFNNLSYFTKCFKDLHHYTPRDYARRASGL